MQTLLSAGNDTVIARISRALSTPYSWDENALACGVSLSDVMREAARGTVAVSVDDDVPSSYAPTTVATVRAR